MTDRQDAIVEALELCDEMALRRLAATATDEEERLELIQYANNIEDADWAYDRMRDEQLTEVY
jgi:hypothetical protein